MIGIAGQARRCVQSPGCFLLNMRGSLKRSGASIPHLLKYYM